MSATAFQRFRREVAARKQAKESQQEEHELTKKELMALLNEKGIEFDAKSNKETLFKLLEGAE